MGKVYIVGAGPGDPELITVKGLKCIQTADVILYDRLVNKELLSYAKKDAELIYCGKLPHYHAMKQETINHFLVKYGKRGKVVTRLKGGDPFVFGRGAEEAEALLKNGISFEIIPGISSGIAAPSYAGIPVTHREYSASVAFVTGHRKGENIEEINWKYLAKAVDTLCIYMGVQNLSSIVKELIHAGKSPTTPIALIENGTLKVQRKVIGTLQTIEQLVEIEKIQNPSMIVIGNVVNLSQRLSWFEQLNTSHYQVGEGF